MWPKFVLELRLGWSVEFLLWSANIVLSELNSRPFFPTVPFRSFSRTSRFRSVAHCSLDFSSVPFPSRCALLARLSVRYVSVSSRVARSTSRVSFASLRVERIAFSAPLLFLSGTVCSTTLFALWVVCFTDCLQCAVFGVFCVGFVLRVLGLFGVCIWNITECSGRIAGLWK